MNETVAIGIPTYKRPKGLRLLLESLASIKSIQKKIIVVVADNQGQSGAGLEELKRDYYNSYPFEIISFPVADVGISQVRNALLNYCFRELDASALVMVDDDEIVEENWLYELHKLHTQGGFDVVGGAVYPRFTAENPEWTEDLQYYYRPIYKSGAINLIQGTTSVYLSRSIWEKYPNTYFDLSFSKTGGGDKEYFTRLKNKGASFAFSAEAISHEFFDSSRLNLDWAKQRAYRIGSGDTRIIIKHEGYLFALLKQLPKALIVSLFCLIKLPLSAGKRKIHLKILLNRQLGKLSSLRGKKIDVYSKTHGA